jgi:hypothetical protein
VLINNFVVALKRATIWSSLDFLHVYAAADSQAALINWVNPGTFTGTLVNSPTFTTDRGFTVFNPVYVDTGYDPTVNAINYSQNGACRFARSLTNDPGAGANWYFASQENAGSDTGGDRLLLRDLGDDTDHVTINGIDDMRVAWSTFGGLIFMAANVSGASAGQQYINGSSVATSTNSTSALQAGHFIAGGTAHSGTGICASHGCGGSLTAAQHLALFNAEHAYMQGVGAAT